MVWFDSGTGYVKLRNPTNSAWQTIGTIGPPMKFTNVDLPDTSFTTGDVKQTFKAVADSGWVMMNDGTIGDGSSGAWTRANPDTQALFTLLWNNIADAYCPLLAAGTGTGTGRGASAAADWAAHRHIALPRALGRVFAHAGAGYGLLNYAFGSFWGNETVALGLNNIPSHAHSFTVAAAHSLAGQRQEQPAGQHQLRHVDGHQRQRPSGRPSRRPRLAALPATPALPAAARRTSTSSRPPTSTS